MKTWRFTIHHEKTLSNLHSTFNLVILSAVLLAALALRLYKLDAGLWFDEITTYVTYARMPFKQIVSVYYSENQNFLYSLLAHASFLIFGESAWALRLPAVLFGVASIGMVYLLGRQVSNRLESLFSAALLAFSYHHLWFSQNARGYTGLLFWTLLTSWLLVRGLNGAKPWLWLLYAVAAALGVYTHLTMVFVIVGQFVVYLVGLVARGRGSGQRRWVGIFLGFCVAGLLALLLHSPALTQMSSTIGGSQESVVAEWKSPLWTVLEIFKGLRTSFLGGAMGLGALLVFAAGLISYWHINRVIVQLLIVPVVIGSVVTLALGHHLWPRFFFFTIGFGALIIIRGFVVLGNVVAKLLHIPRDKVIWVSSGLCAGLVILSAVSMVFAYGPKQDYDGARAFVESEKAPGDAVVVVDIAADVYERFYELPWDTIGSVDALNAIRSRSRRVWLIYTFPPVLRAARPDIMASIETDFQLVKAFPGTVTGGTVFVCTSDKLPRYAD